MAGLRPAVFAAPAREDLGGIVDYIALDNPKAAESVFRAIVATTERLAKFPNIGRPGRLADTREFRASRLPYLIVYEAGSDQATILAVFHTSRDLARALAARKAELAKPG